MDKFITSVDFIFGMFTQIFYFISAQHPVFQICAFLPVTLLILGLFIKFFKKD